MEYKHVVLGLIFLRYISEAFEDLYEKLKKGEGEYEGAVYARGNIDPIALGGLIDLFSNIAINEAKEKTSDILGHVFEYFLGEFALAEGKKGGQFYTPRSVVELLVEMLEPYRGRVFDPCCGSGGMFVQSEKFVQEHQGKINDISIYGQESNQTTWRLCKMNLAIRGIDSSQVKWNPEGSFLNDAHKDLKSRCKMEIWRAACWQRKLCMDSTLHLSPCTSWKSWLCLSKRSTYYKTECRI
nr:class I SAM-dependent DNA methyltransferase [Lebetimonas sp. JH292]